MYIACIDFECSITENLLRQKERLPFEAESDYFFNEIRPPCGIGDFWKLHATRINTRVFLKRNSKSVSSFHLSNYSRNCSHFFSRRSLLNRGTTAGLCIPMRVPPILIPLTHASLIKGNQTFQDINHQTLHQHE